MDIDRYKEQLKGICNAKDIIAKTPLSGDKNDNQDLIQIHQLLQKLENKHKDDIKYFMIRK